MFEYIYELSAVTWLIIGLIFIALGWGYVNMGFTAQTKKILKVIGVVSLLCAAAVGGLFAAQEETLVADPTASWDWVHSSGDTAGLSIANNTTVTGDRTYLVTFDASGAGTIDEGTINVDYAVFRDDTSTADAVGRCYVVSVGQVYNSTSGVTHDVLAKNTDGSWDVAWDDGTTTFDEEMTFPPDPSTRSLILGLALEISPTAVDSMSDYDTATITVSVGGITDTITIMRTS